MQESLVTFTACHNFHAMYNVAYRNPFAGLKQHTCGK